MNIVIHQPYFLPWMGYFSKLVYSDVFVVLDNVNFTKGSYIDRVKIINTDGEIMWIGLNVGQHYKAKCNEIKFGKLENLNRILKTIHHSYAKARFYESNIDSINNIIIESFSNSEYITELNVNIIKRLINLLKLKMPKIILSSDLKEEYDSTERIIEFCHQNKCNNLIVGSMLSINAHDIGSLNRHGIEISIHDFYNNHPSYYQSRRTKLGFAKGLSVIDCIFNEGVDFTKKLLEDSKHIPQIYNQPVYEK